MNVSSIGYINLIDHFVLRLIYTATPTAWWKPKFKITKAALIWKLFTINTSLYSPVSILVPPWGQNLLPWKFDNIFQVCCVDQYLTRSISPFLI